MRRLPTVSIIIPTSNRGDSLLEALQSLDKLDYPREDLEVIVVDDGSTDNTLDMLEKIKTSLSYKLRYYCQDKKGISTAKNLGIQKSNGEVIVSTDDDCLFERDWLIKLVSAFDSPEVGSIGGPDRAYKKDSFLAKSISYAFSSFVGSGGIHGCPFKRIKLGKFYPMGCNMAIPRRVFDEVGLFDATLAPGEETDLNHRIERAGYVLKLVPDAFVWHKARNSLRGFITHIFRRGYARTEIIRKHREYAEFIYFIPALAVSTFILLIVLSFFSSWAMYCLMVLIGIYSLLLLSAGISAFRVYKSMGYLVVIPVLIAFEHILHGVGFLTGIFKLVIRRVTCGREKKVADC